MEAFLDPYTLRARVYPGLLILTPILITAAAIFREALTELSAILSVLVAGGILYLLSHIIRQAGRSKEPKLWRSWGGKPTTVLLRWRTAEPQRSRDLTRSRLSRLALDLTLPTPEEERADPTDADRRYDAAVSVLREATRDKKRFPVVFAENVSYGFRRNTLGIRPIGLLSAAVALAAGVQHLVRLPDMTLLVNPLLSAAITIDLLLLCFWLLIVSADWVRQAADIYAEALFSAASVVLDR